MYSFPNQSIVPCLVLTIASWPAYRFLRRQVKYPHLLKHFPQFVVIHTVKDFNVVNKANVDFFLKFPCFLHDPVIVDNLTPGSSAFSKSSLYVWKFSVHILLKPNLKDFEHYFASMWHCTVIGTLWHCPSLVLEWKLAFSSPLASADFSKFAGIFSAAL